MLKASKIQNLYLVDSNQSFLSANNDSFYFKLMLPDSHIARVYSRLGETKDK